MNKKAVSSLVLGLVTIGAAPAARGQAPEITHDSVACIVAGKYPKLKACFSPQANVAKARVFFRREDRPIWYHVEMSADEQCFQGVLPRPTKELIGKKVPYYVEVANQTLDVGRTQEHRPEVVRTETECKLQSVAPYLAKAVVKVFPAMPPGFSGGGIGRGLIAGGAAVVGIGVGVVAGRGGDDATPPPGPSTGPSPAPSPSPSPSGPGPSPSPTPGPNGPPVGVFAVTPDPPAGVSPMSVRFNLCRSTDPDDDPLTFRYDFGDGQKARGSCREDHVYVTPAASQAAAKAVADVVYKAIACVTDGRVGNEQCKTFEVRVQTEPVPPQTSGLTVGLAGTGAGNVTGPGGIDCPGVCTANLPDGSAATLTANPAPGSTFAGWSVAACGASPTCTVTMNGAQSVTATFNLIAINFPLNVTVAGTGTGSVTGPGGINCPGVCTASFASGSTVTLNANVGVGSVFAGWSVAACGTNLTCPVTMTSAQSVTATFNLVAANFQLTVALAGNGSGSVFSDTGGIDCPETCTGTYPSGTPVLLTARPDVGSTLAGWSVASCGTSLTCSVTVTANQTVTTTFNLVAANFPLSVSLDGTGSGFVESNPTGISCPKSCSAEFPSGSTVTLLPTANTGSAFIRWSLASCGTARTCPVPMTSAQSVTATFDVIIGIRRITVNRSGNGGVIESDVQPGIVCGTACSYPDFADGSTVVLTVETFPGWIWSGWTGDCSGTGPTCTLVMTQDRMVNAVFVVPETPQSRPASAQSWLSDLRVPRGKGQVVVNQRAWEVGQGQQRSMLETPPGDGRVEATLTQGAGAGTWRFELPDALIEPGSLRVVEGKVETMGGTAVVFRLAGKAGERVVFTYRPASAPR